MSADDAFSLNARLREVQRSALSRRPAEAAPPLAPGPGSPDQITFNLSVNLTGAISGVIRGRDPTGQPAIPDEAVERLYDVVRDELLRRGKKV